MSNKPKRWRTRSVGRAAPLMEELEPRLLFSADSAGLMTPDLFTSHQPATNILLDDNFDPVLPSAYQASTDDQRLELVFVDTDTPDYQELVDDLLAERDDGRHIEVFILDNDRDGIEQITQTLKRYEDVDAIHLISHGDDGSIDLGNSRLSRDALAGYETQMQSWELFLDADADILIYGCNLAASIEGQYLITQLAAVTGADIAASDDLTGSESLGGDWVLERNTGLIESDVAISADARAAYSGILAPNELIIEMTSTPSISEELVETTTFTITLSGNAVTGGNTASVDIVGSGSALSGTDYDNFVTAVTTAAAATTGVTFDGTDTLTFDSSFNAGTGLGAFSFTMDAINDGAMEGTETIIATLSNASVTSGTVGFATVSDSFTETSNTVITSHTPDAGVSWTKIYDDTAYAEVFVDATLDVIQGGAGSGNDTGQAYTAGPAPTSVDQTISFTLTTIETDSGTKPVGVFGRSTDVNNFYYLRILPNDNAQDSISLWKMVAGVPTQLATIDPTIANGDTFKLEITDATKKVYHNGTEVLSSTDNGLTAAGTWGFFIGNFNGVGGHYRDNWQIDDFRAQDTSSAASATTNITETDVNNPPTGSVTISGTPTEDQVLTAANTLADLDGLGTITYQWQRDGVDISGATASTYTLVQADVGTMITVDADYTDGATNAESASSAGVGPIANVNDTPAGLPVVTGTVTEDQILTADTSGITDEDGVGAFSYQWHRDGVDIGGATASTYTLVDADVGTQISVEVSYTDDESTAEGPLTSTLTAAVANVNDTPTGSVTISGTPTEDQILTAANTLADADGMGAVTYQWQRDGVDISGATASTYTLVQSDVGTTITVDADYTDGESTAESVSSAGVGPIANVNDTPAGLPVITGTVTEDQILTADTSGITDEDGVGAFSYQWHRDGVDIGGATASTYTLVDADVGTQISVEVSYTDDESTAEGPLTSTLTAAVANVNDTPTGSVTISGTPTEDQILTAANTLADADGMGAITYQWQRDGVDISGATASTYTLLQADVGTTITVDADYTDGESTAESVSSAGVGPIANINDTPAGLPVITGTVTEDQILTADTSGITDEDGVGAFSYQWHRDGVDIGGATASTYTLVDADVGTQISVEVSYTDDESTAEGPLTSTLTAAVANVNDTPTGSVTISGTPTEDQILTAANTLADADGMGAVTYQWQRDGVDISGATASTYTLVQSDVGTTITVDADYTDGESTAESVSSAGVGPIANINDTPAGLPVITGTVTEDQTLTADTSGITDEDGVGAFSYQWHRDGVDIGGATASTYTLVDADVGTQISVEVSYTDDESTAEGPLTSTLTAAVANVNDTPTGSVTISGTPTEDQILTAANTLADADGMGAVTYQWQRDGVDISGATASTYTLVQSDVGTTITVDADYTDGESTAESVASAGVGPIANVNDIPAGSVTISGTPTEDQILTAAHTLTDEDGMGAVTYQWQRDGVDISGATSSTYTLVQADVGTMITVDADYTDGESTAESVASAGVGPISNVNDTPAGLPVITGTVTEDQTLTADTSGITDEDGVGVFTYQWHRDGVDIGGATASTYTLVDADVGTQISVEVSYTDDESTAEGPLTSTLTAAVANVNDTPTGSVTISGTPTEDQVLTAANTLADDDGLGAITYQWQRDGVDISGATASTYTLLQSDVGTTITVDADYTDGESTAESVASAGVGPIANVNDIPAGSVTISGTPTEDQILTAAHTLTDEDGMGAVTYQWQRDGVDISGATSSTYTLVQADVGTMITVDADYTDGESTAESVSSASVGPIANVNDTPTGSVLIDNMNPAEGGTLNASNTLADTDGLSGPISYQWQRDGVDISGATSSAYTAVALDVGTALSVVASYTDDEGTAEGVSSASTAAVTSSGNNAPTGSVTISGTPIEDQALTAANTLADADGMGAVTYQWQRDGIDIVDATASTYTLVQADVGTTITARASYTDGGSTPESVSSASVGPIVNVNDTPAGVPVITGTVTEDQTLTADTSGITDEDGVGVFTYQWHRDGVDIGGATASTYTLADADVGTQISVEVSYTDGESTAEGPLTSVLTAAVLNVNDAPTGSVTITGTPTEDETLTATNTLADADGMGMISYQWQRDGADISGAIGDTYPLGQTDVGSTITAQASYADGDGNAESVSSEAVGPIANVNDVPIGIPVITGTVTEGQIVNADTSGITDEDGLGNFTYQWQRDGVDIVGATVSAYTLANGDVGTQISVAVSYTDDRGTVEQVASASVVPVSNLNNAPTGSVTIGGTPTEDQTLTAANTLADADGLGTISYQWQRDGADISGATGDTYTLAQADVGSTITAQASYTDGESATETVSSEAVGPIANVNDEPTGIPVITGTVIEDQMIRADTGHITDEDGVGAFTYQWRRDGVDIIGATVSGYALVDADVGTQISVLVSYTDDQGNVEQVASTSVVPASKLNNAPTGTVRITGTPTEDQILTATNTLTDADGMGAISYQWQRDGIDISGATDDTYTLGQADVASTITVDAHYTDGEGTTESVSSEAIGPIANVNDVPAGAVTLSGNPVEGQILTAANTLTDADGIGEISYQWYRDGDEIAGATASTYTLTQADIGTTITVSGFYTDQLGINESVSSNGVTPLARAAEDETDPVAEASIQETLASSSDQIPASTTKATESILADPPATPFDSDSPFPDSTAPTGTRADPSIKTETETVAEPEADVATEEATEEAEAEAEAETEVESEAEAEADDTVLPELEELDADPQTYQDETGKFVDNVGGNQVVPAQVDVIKRTVDPEAALRNKIEIQHMRAVLTDHEMWTAIDEMKQQIDDQQEQIESTPEELVVQVVSTSGIGMAAGAAGYALRGGALLASLMSAMPLWSVYDPLPILDVAGKDKDSESGKDPKDPHDGVENLFTDSGEAIR